MTTPTLCPACGARNDCALADPRTADQACWSEMGLEVLRQVVGPAETLAAVGDRALVGALLRVRAIVALEVLHALEPPAAVTHMQLVC